MTRRRMMMMISHWQAHPHSHSQLVFAVAVAAAASTAPTAPPSSSPPPPPSPFSSNTPSDKTVSPSRFGYTTKNIFQASHVVELPSLPVELVPGLPPPPPQRLGFGIGSTGGSGRVSWREEWQRWGGSMGRVGLSCRRRRRCCRRCCCRSPRFLAGMLGPTAEKTLLKMLEAAWWGGDGATEMDGKSM